MRVFVRGAVQGVGFRPFVYKLAKKSGLGGWVLNSPQGVQIEVEGKQPDLEEFLIRLQKDKPRLAFIQSLEWSYLAPANLGKFEIRKSKAGGEKLTFLLPDIATCDSCLEETMDAKDRRYLYPFTNCTLCGPRFSIIEKLPYDRPNTSMKAFRMCPACAKEYKDPEDRRFHAQPIACHVCGPRLHLLDGKGAPMAGEEEALLMACAVVRGGRILGLKGIGGFLLLADARNEEALTRLRQRKLREEKPLALMYLDLKSVEKD
jgi:hydrogenase maturation protein HypF